MESGECRVESGEEWIREWGVTERRLEGGMSTAAAVQQLYSTGMLFVSF